MANMIADALRARQLYIHARDGDADAFNTYVKEMLTRGATRAEQFMLRDLMAGTEPTSRITITTVTRKRGRPGGPPAQLRTAHGINSRARLTSRTPREGRGLDGVRPIRPVRAPSYEYVAWQVPVTAVNIAYWTPLIVCSV